jgi:CTP:molybdopterin cytidylyltransferase MocA
MIAGIVLAAGRSLRMGRPKLLLPMPDGRPIIAHAIGVLREGGASPILVVIGGEEGMAEAVVLAGGRPTPIDHAAAGDMFASLQHGLKDLIGMTAEAALVLPGDMPFVKPTTVRSLSDLWILERPSLLVPSYRNRRGHPVCLARETWADILALQPPASLRDYLRRQAASIRHLVVEDIGVVKDIDIPEDYDRAVGPAGA